MSSQSLPGLASKTDFPRNPASALQRETFLDVGLVSFRSSPDASIAVGYRCRPRMETRQRLTPAVVREQAPQFQLNDMHVELCDLEPRAGFQLELGIVLRMMGQKMN